jgi:methionyl-tRNA formyltransferase
MSLRIVFLGTPEFATTSLRAIHESNHQIVGVVTAPDKPAGRGQQMQMSDVKKYALEQKLHLMQPEKLRDEDFLKELRSLNADLFVVVAFRMLPEIVWNMPPRGTVNLHGSRLPQYRGAAPIQWAVMNGEKTTGCSVFQLTHEIDTGDVLNMNEIRIGENETAGELYERMMHAGAALLVETLSQIEQGQVNPKKQLECATEAIKSAPKLEKENGRINVEQTPHEVHNHVRGVTPFPGAFTTIQNKLLKVHQGRPVLIEHSQEFGTFRTNRKSELLLALPHGYYELIEVQLEGKKRMLIDEFLRGNANLFS